MKVIEDKIEFDWDAGNLDKNRRKHGVECDEAESVFLDKEALVSTDTGHSQAEERLKILGKSNKERRVFIIFTMRKEKIRIISARRANRKEVKEYEKIKKHS